MYGPQQQFGGTVPQCDHAVGKCHICSGLVCIDLTRKTKIGQLQVPVITQQQVGACSNANKGNK